MSSQTNKFLKEVIGLVANKQAEDVVDMLEDGKHINEFLIAKKLGITINQTRNILYKISDQGLISSIRKKDKRKGWYTYFWKIETMKSLDFLKDLIVKNINQFNSQIRVRENEDFYVCKDCNLELGAENALLRDFTCNECGNVYTLKDNSKLLNELKREVAKLEKKLELVNDEISLEQQKLDKKKDRELKKEAKEKAEKRKETAAKIKASKNKSLAENTKKSLKKTSEKKVIKKSSAKKAPVKKSVKVKKEASKKPKKVVSKKKK